jgi:uncharacterized glyoxalase superfamily protein PhnB
MTTKPPNLNQLNIVARDFDRTLAFYRRLGVDIEESGGGDGIRHVAVTLGNGLLLEFDNVELARMYNAARRQGAGSGVVIGFSVATREAVDERYADLVAAGYEGRQPPWDAFWGARFAIVADPEGNDVGIMSPIEQARKWWPPHESPDR